MDFAACSGNACLGKKAQADRREPMDVTRTTLHTQAKRLMSSPQVAVNYFFQFAIRNRVIDQILFA